MTAKHHRVLVTGAGGQLGSAIGKAFSHAGHCVFPLDRAKLDITDSDQAMETVREVRPDVIINCSAYNAVDAAEAQVSTAFAINAHGPAVLSAAATEIGAVLVHYSSDFVFDGKASTPYDEDAARNPLGVYGASKLAGEDAVRLRDQHYILRVESLFGGHTKPSSRTTVDFLIENLTQGRSVRGAIDRTVSPSYVPHVVRATLALISSGRYGTYHCVASGHSTWFELAHEIAALVGAPPQLVTPIAAEGLPTVANRPLFCALSNLKIRRLGIVMPTWRATLRAHLASRRRLIVSPENQQGIQVA